MTDEEKDLADMTEQIAAQQAEKDKLEKMQRDMEKEVEKAK